MRRRIEVERLKLHTLGVQRAVLLVGVGLVLFATWNVISSVDVHRAPQVLRGEGFEVHGVRPVPTAVADADDARRVLGTWSLVAIVTFSLGVFAAAVERRHGTLAASVLAAPRRAALVLAKAGGVLPTALAVAGGALALDLVVGGGWIARHDLGTHVATDARLLAAAGGLAACALVAMLGVGVGFGCTAPSTGIVLGLIMLLVAEPALAARRPSVARWLPGHATDAAFGA